MAITSLVLGIVGFFLAWIPLFGYILPILAIVFGAIGKSEEKRKGMAIAGLTLGILALIIFKLFFWIAVFFNII